jgi:erythronate-4-phosphate dehydrogenase
MKIIADENIPRVSEAFGALGEVTLVHGRHLRPEQVREADVLLVRSVTRVDERLLAGSRVRFVGSATIGFDHVDREYLATRDIGFATAPGSNAISAAEYVVAVLMVLSRQQGFRLAGRTAGIIGCGNVGSRVRARLAALGMECRVNDPPLHAAGAPGEYVSLEDALACDIVTVHVPLEPGGDHPTWHLIDTEALARLRPGAILLNTSRGAVADNAALLDVLRRRDDLTAVLDVWEGEPAISLALLEQVALGTPHIAGYSLDGKLRGTEMIYRAACDFLAAPVTWDVRRVLPPVAPVDVSALADTDPEALARAAVLGCYDVRTDDEHLRRLFELAPEERPAYFDRLRKEYPVRREFAATPLVHGPLSDAQRQILAGLGFAV